MQIQISTEDLSNVDCGGGMRRLTCDITVDSTLPLRRQREIVIYEVLGAFLDNELEERHDYLELVADKIVEALDEIALTQ